MKNIKGLFFWGFLGGGFVLFLVDVRFFMFVIEGRRKKEEGRRKKEEGRITPPKGGNSGRSHIKSVDIGIIISLFSFSVSSVSSVV
ncbi:MAG: hypothetical protein ACBR12_05690 [Microcoleus sp.]